MATGLKNINTQLSLVEKLFAWTGVIGLLTWLLYQHLNADFWNDELYTLEHFVRVELRQTLLDYHVPNNHVFFSLLLNIYLKFIGSPELLGLLQSPYLLRLVPAIFLGLSLVSLYRANVKIGGQRFAILSLLVLLSFMPFQNFALQLRAYGWSIFMFSVVYYSLLSYQLNPKLRYLLILTLSSCLAFYALPSNLYYVLAALAFLFFSSLLKAFRSSPLRLKAEYYRPILALVAGLGLGLLCYWPIFQAVFFNPYVSQSDFFDLKTLQFHLLHLWEAFSYGLVPIFILASLAIFFRIDPKMRIALGLATAFVFIPLLISFMRGDNAPPRVFIPASPFIAIIVALFLDKLIGFLALRWKLVSKMVFVFIPSFLVVNAILSQLNYEQEIERKLSVNERPQGLLYQFYSAHYHPLQTVRHLDSILEINPQQVLVIGCEPHGIKHYLQAHQIEFVHDFNQPQSLDRLKQGGQPFYLISDQFMPLNLKDVYQAEPLLGDQSYHNLFQVSLDDDLIRTVGQALAIEDRPSLETDMLHQFLLKQWILKPLQEGCEMSSAKAPKRILLDLPLSQSAWMIEHFHEYQIDSVSRWPGFRLFWLSLLPADSSSAQIVLDTNLLRLNSENAFFKLYNEQGFHQNRFFEFSAFCSSDLKDPGVLALQVDRDGEKVHWQAWHWKNYIQTEDDGKIVITLELDYNLKPKDKWSFYLWAHNGDSVMLRNMSFRAW